MSSTPANRCHRLLTAAASVNATNVAAEPVRLAGIQGYNAKAAAVYLKLYEKATAPSEADTPEKTIYLPATSAFAIPLDYAFQTGLGYRLTAAAADNDTTALSSGDILALNLDYRLERS